MRKFSTGTVLKHTTFSTSTAVCVTQLSLVLFFEYYITTVHEAVHAPDAAVHGPCSIAAVHTYYSSSTAVCTGYTQLYTGFTFLSTVKSTKFSRPGYPGILNLVPWVLNLVLRRAERIVKPVRFCMRNGSEERLRKAVFV